MDHTIRAIFTTRCGCTKELQITFPPPPSIVFPMKPRKEWGPPPVDLQDNRKMEIRQFYLKETVGVWPDVKGIRAIDLKNVTAIYTEEGC